METRRETLRARTQALESACRRHGLPVTIQRRVIFEFLADREDHPTADQVYEAARKRIPRISRTTAYRVLETLIRIGALSRVCHPGTTTRFDAKLERHHHILCSLCGGIVDVEDPRLDTLPLPEVRKRGFKINQYSILFHGVCSDCRGGSRETESRRRVSWPRHSRT